MYDVYETETTSKKNKKQGLERFLTIRWIIGGILIFMAIISGLITFFNSFTVVQAGYVGVQYGLNGGVKEEILQPGWRWHSPFTNVTQYPTSKETVTLVKTEKHDNSFSVNTSDGKSVDVDMTYTYSFVPEKTPYIFTRFRRASAETINDTWIKQQLKGAIQSVTTSYSVVEVYGGEKRTEITKKVQQEFENRLNKEGVIGEDFTFQDIRPDEKTLVAIQAIVDSKNKEELLKQQNKNLEQEKLNKTLEAETAKEVAIIAADQAAESSKIKAKQDAANVIIAADAQAAANAKLNASISDKLLQKQLIETLPDVKFPQIMTGNGSGSILNLPSDFVKSQVEKK